MTDIKARVGFVSGEDITSSMERLLARIEARA